MPRFSNYEGIAAALAIIVASTATGFGAEVSSSSALAPWRNKWDGYLGAGRLPPKQSQALILANFHYWRGCEAESRDRFEAAVDDLRQAIVQYEIAWGRYSPTLNGCLYRLGQIELHLKQFAAAEWRFRRCLNFYLLRSKGVEDSSTTICAAYLGVVCCERENFAEGKILLTRVVDWERKQPALSSSYDWALSWRSHAAYELGEWTLAAEGYQELSSREDQINVAPENRAATRIQLAKVEMQRKALDAVVHYADEALQLAPDAPPAMWTIDAYYLRGRAHRLREDFETAVADQTNALQIARALKLDDTQKMAEILEELAAVHARRENLADARAALDEALAIRLRLFGPEHWSTKDVQEALGTLLQFIDVQSQRMPSPRLLSHDQHRQLNEAYRADRLAVRNVKSKPNEALQQLEQARALVDQACGPADRRTVEATVRLMSCRINLHVATIEQLEETAGLAAAVCGQDSPEFARACEMTGYWMLNDNGDPISIISLLTRARDIYRSWGPAASDLQGQVCFMLGAAAERNNDLEAGLQHLREAEHLLHDSPIRQRHRLADTLGLMAWVLAKQGNAEDARRSIAEFERVAADCPAEALSTNGYDFAGIALALLDDERSLSLLTKSHQQTLATKGETSPATLVALKQLGMVAARFRQWDRAQSALLKAAVGLSKSDRRQDRYSGIEAWCQAATVYKNLDSPEKAMECLDEAKRVLNLDEQPDEEALKQIQKEYEQLAAKHSQKNLR